MTKRRCLPFASEGIFQHGSPAWKEARSAEINVIPELSRSQTLTASAGSGPRERTVSVNRRASPGRTVRLEGLSTRLSAAAPRPTFVVTCAMLFASSGSGVGEVTLAVLRSSPVRVG